MIAYDSVLYLINLYTRFEFIQYKFYILCFYIIKIMFVLMIFGLMTVLEKLFLGTLVRITSLKASLTLIKVSTENHVQRESTVCCGFLLATRARSITIGPLP